jgi:hypothetical protein
MRRNQYKYWWRNKRLWSDEQKKVFLRELILSV